ncbi:AP-4 complex accessory subunit RUSC2 isoform 2-T10 [Spinachia spinachia]
MIAAPSLPGDTLIACRYPVVRLPTWQLKALCRSAKRPGRLCSAGLTRAVSLPERDSHSPEHSVAGGRRHFSSSYGSLNEDRAEDEGGSDSSGKYDSTSSPEETSSRLRMEGCGARDSLRSHNSFIPSAEVDEDQEDEDSDGDNLHRYREDSSFVLHGNSNWPLSNPAMSNGDMDGEWGNEDTVLGSRSGQEWLPHQPDSLQTECQCFTGTAYGEHASERGGHKTSCCIHRRHKCSPELFSNSLTEYVSDSSCNSSDGVLVNFCTIYNRSNNPATPNDLSGAAAQPYQSSEGSVFLNLQPVPQTPAENVQRDDVAVNAPCSEEVDVSPPSPRWSPQGLDSNCNLYSLEPPPPGLSSLEVSDLVACLQSQATLAMETNQKYYKLVTCDLSSQSPSPAWSSLTSCTEGHIRWSSFPPPERPSADHKKEGQDKRIQKEEDLQKEKRFPSGQLSTGFDRSHDYQAAPTQKSPSEKEHTDTFQFLSHTPCSQHSCNGRGTSAASTQPSVSPHQEPWETDATVKGACSLENAVVRYSKAQRPTSLPIQPFVLAPAGKPRSQHLGGLLEQYVNQKSSNCGSSHPGLKFNVKRSQCFSNLQLSPMSDRFPVLLEAPLSSDTCSTCTPSPEWSASRGRMWSHFSGGRGRPGPRASKISPGPPRSSSPKPIPVQDKSLYPGVAEDTGFNLFSTPNPTNLVKLPGNQTLINLTPEDSHGNTEAMGPNRHQTYNFCDPVFSHTITPPTLLLTTDTRHPNLQVCLSPPTTKQPGRKFPQHRAATGAAKSGFFPGSLTAALSSVAPLSSLSGLLSLAASGLQIPDCAGTSGKQSRPSESLILSDRPPTEFCLSPETSYESMSISHLQRRGLLRSVSRAVDLIMAHFGSSRNPEEKMRLGSSSRSPTIAGLVLEHLCPAIQNILEDGLRDHQLDLVIGQRRNNCWSVVEVSTRLGPSTKVLHSLVSKIRQYPQLTSHCMRLRAFLMGLLNLRRLEFWLSHLQSLKAAVSTHYHSWGFLSTSLGRCQPLFQELLLLLQPLSVLPFDLNLLLEPRLLRNRQLCSEEQGVPPPPPCSALLVTSWPLLQAEQKVDTSDCSQRTKTYPQESLGAQSGVGPDGGGTRADKSPSSAPIPEWWPKGPHLVDGVVEGEDCSQNYAGNWPQISMDGKQEEKIAERDNETLSAPARVQAESPCQGGLRWAKLFGASAASTRTETFSPSGAQARRYRRPSQWLKFDTSQLGLLAQSIRSMKRGGAQTNEDC